MNMNPDTAADAGLIADAAPSSLPHLLRMASGLSSVPPIVAEMMTRTARRLEVAQRMAEALKEGAEWLEQFSVCAADDNAAERMRAVLAEWDGLK